MVLPDSGEKLHTLRSGGTFMMRQQGKCVEGVVDDRV